MRTCFRILGGVLAVILVVAGPVAAADVTQGKVLFEQKCAMCHAKDLQGNPAMAKMFKLDQSALNLLKKETLDKKDADLVATTTNGKNKMPAYKDKLKPEEIANVITYLRGVTPAKSASQAAPAAK